jgi:hypothetical protein
VGHPRYPRRPRFYQRNDAQANSAVTNGNDRDESSSAGFTLTKAQYSHLISLQQNSVSSHSGLEDNTQPNFVQIAAPNNHMGITYISCLTVTRALSFTSSHTTPWIIDSGAIDHISCYLNTFSSYNKIPPIKINLPNGVFVFAHYSGIIKFSPNFILYNVLYVLEFNFNLLSISKIISKFSHSLFFYGDSCIIQDVNSRQMIRQAKLKEGLYHLQINKPATLQTTPPPFINASITNHVTKNNLWHHRLGHLSSDRLKVLQRQFPFISYHSNEACDVCHLAKQRKLSYSPSVSRALETFHLLHMDI